MDTYRYRFIYTFSLMISGAIAEKRDVETGEVKLE